MPIFNNANLRVGAALVAAAYVGSTSVLSSGAFSPLSLFAAGEQGVWYDPSDFSSLYQDSAGTTPVTGVDQPVGKMLDKSGRGNHATQPVAINRPVLRQDGSGKYYLAFNGTNSWMVSSAINFSASDAMTITLGLGTSVTSPGIVTELSVTANSNAGAFYVAANETADKDSFKVRGSISTPVTQTGTLSNPRTTVMSCLGKISTDTQVIRINGVQDAQSAADIGAGMFGNYPLYIGARAGSSVFFNGKLYSMIIRGVLGTDPEITSAESFVNSKTGAF